MAIAGTRTLIEGTDFGDNIIASLPDVIGQTIGDLLVGAALNNNPTATQTVQGILDEAALKRGLKPGTPEYKEAADITTPENKKFVADVDDGRGSNDPELFEEVTEENVQRLLKVSDEEMEQAREITGRTQKRGDAVTPDSSSSRPRGTSSASVPSGSSASVQSADDSAEADPAELEEIIVIGGIDDKGPAIHKLADPLAIKSGQIVRRAGENVQEYIDRTPGASTAVTIVDWGLKIAGGPVRYAIGEVVGRASKEASDKLTDRFERKRYATQDASDGGKGGIAVLVGLTKGIVAGLAIVGVVLGAKKLASRGGSRDQVLKKFGFKLDDLRTAGTAADRGPYTKAGRALTKHGAGQRASGTFPAPKGSPTDINLQGQNAMNAILDNPRSTFVVTKGGNLVVRAPNGQGLQFRTDGTLSGFLD